MCYCILPVVSSSLPLTGHPPGRSNDGRDPLAGQNLPAKCTPSSCSPLNHLTTRTKSMVRPALPSILTQLTCLLRWEIWSKLGLASPLCERCCQTRSFFSMILTTVIGKRHICQALCCYHSFPGEDRWGTWPADTRTHWSMHSKLARKCGFLKMVC